MAGMKHLWVLSRNSQQHNSSDDSVSALQNVKVNLADHQSSVSVFCPFEQWKIDSYQLHLLDKLVGFPATRFSPFCHQAFPAVGVFLRRMLNISQLQAWRFTANPDL